MTKKELLNRYFNDQLNKEEMFLLLTYLEAAEEPEDRELYKSIWEEYSSGKYFLPKESSHFLQQTKQKLQNEKLFIIDKENKQWYKSNLAAVLIGLLIFSVALILFLHKVEQKQEFSTSFGETKTFLLPDGSEVTLNANSSIYYYINWEPKSNIFKVNKEIPVRQVWLNGEAFFSVKSMNNQQKFLVHTDDMKVEVLGTTFNVNNRRNKTQVVLNSGKIKLNFNNEAHPELIMNPGELAEFSKEEKKLTKENVDTQSYISWKNKLLVFDDTPINKIALILEDTYGFKVEISDPSLGDIVFSAKVPSDDLETLLTLLARSCNVKIEKSHSTINIKEIDH